MGQNADGPRGKAGIMKYMLLIYGDEGAIAHATPEQNQAVADEYEVFTKSIVESGNFLDGDPFLPTGTSRTIRVQDGEMSETEAFTKSK